MIILINNYVWLVSGHHVGTEEHCYYFNIDKIAALRDWTG